MDYMKKLNTARAVVGSSLLAGSIAAHAALPTAVTGAFTSLQSDGEALIDLAWPVVVALVGGFILIKLFKRAAGKL